MEIIRSLYGHPLADETARQAAAENAEGIVQLSEEMAALKGEDSGGAISIEFTDADVITDAFITPEGVTSATASGYSCIDYAAIGNFKSGEPITIRCTIIGNCSLVFYDSARSVLLAISGSNAAEYGITPGWPMQFISITPPAGAAYVRFGANAESARGGDYSGPEDFVLEGVSSGGIATRIADLETVSNANLTDFSALRVLVIGDSISADYYGGYPKWVTHLMNAGFFGFDSTVNDSIHATGFVARYNGEANDFITRLEAVADPEGYDLVVVFGGVNDFIQSVPMGESGGDKSANFKPAVDYFFQYLVNHFTQARIAVLTSLRTYATAANSAGSQQTDYADYIASVARSYCLPLLNLTQESGFCPYIDAFKAKWTLIPDGYEDPDGVHPTEEYERRFLAPMIRRFLQGLL